MANEWDAINSVTSAVDVDFVLFNKYGNCIKTWGYGKTPGSQTVDANENNLANLNTLYCKLVLLTTAADAQFQAATTGSVQSTRLSMVARQAGTPDEWHLIAAGSGLGTPALRVVHGTWTNAPKAVFTDTGLAIGLSAPSVPLHVHQTSNAGLRLDTAGVNQLYDMYIDGTTGFLYTVGAQNGFSGYKFYVTDGSGSNAALTLYNNRVVSMDGTWNGGHLEMRGFRLWIDGAGRLRIKSGAPTSDGDGTVVGTQT